MKIVLGYENILKKRSIEMALNSLCINDYEIDCIAANSEVSSKPLNSDTLGETINRNKNLINYLKSNNIYYDLVISIEGGYE